MTVLPPLPPNRPAFVNAAPPRSSEAGTVVTVATSCSSASRLLSALSVNFSRLILSLSVRGL
jgi:hypothetical protein